MSDPTPPNASTSLAQYITALEIPWDLIMERMQALAIYRWTLEDIPSQTLIDTWEPHYDAVFFSQARITGMANSLEFLRSINPEDNPTVFMSILTAALAKDFDESFFPIHEARKLKCLITHPSRTNPPTSVDYVAYRYNRTGRLSKTQQLEKKKGDYRAITFDQHTFVVIDRVIKIMQRERQKQGRYVLVGIKPNADNGIDSVSFGAVHVSRFRETLPQDLQQIFDDVTNHPDDSHTTRGKRMGIPRKTVSKRIGDIQELWRTYEGTA